MQTLADFKRALQTEGVKVETLALTHNAITSGVLASRLRVGMVRKVNIYNTLGVYLKELDDNSSDRGSFLEYGKASEWEFEGDVARNNQYGYAYRIILLVEGADNEL
jgi:hypothetical protein